GDGTQIIDGIGLRLVTHRRSVLGLQRPADECGKAAGARLELAHAVEMLESLGEGFPDAIHHRDRRFHASLMRKLHYLQPAIGPGLLLCDEIAHPLHEDLATTARNRIEARGLELANDVARVHAERLGEEVDFRRTEAVNMN